MGTPELDNLTLKQGIIAKNKGKDLRDWSAEDLAACDFQKELERRWYEARFGEEEF